MIDVPEDKVLEQIAQVASESEFPITTNQVAAVFTAYKNITGGDPLGTIRKNPETGEIAHRVNSEGLHLWRVSHPDGTQYNDLQPTLDWPEV
jgi:hypothetical protein